MEGVGVQMVLLFHREQMDSTVGSVGSRGEVVYI